MRLSKSKIAKLLKIGNQSRKNKKSYSLDNPRRLAFSNDELIVNLEPSKAIMHGNDHRHKHNKHSKSLAASSMHDDINHNKHFKSNQRSAKKGKNNKRQPNCCHHYT